jgi:hypothetical protein
MSCIAGDSVPECKGLALDLIKRVPSAAYCPLSEFFETPGQAR